MIESCFEAWNDPKPIITVSYTPSAPDFTLRDIVSAIASSSKPPFTVTVAKPPSLEERARLMHAREQQRLLMRLLSAVILAIPTFIIGIVYMSLVPDSDPTKQFFMRPMWTGNSSRMQWSLFFLATPVMFYSAGMYHVRSFKEIRALWRRGSRTPIWKRFVRFGSMNLLVRIAHSPASSNAHLPCRSRLAFPSPTSLPSFCSPFPRRNLLQMETRRRTSTPSYFSR